MPEAKNLIEFIATAIDILGVLQLLELRHREDILLPLAPALLDILERDVGRHACGQTAHRRRGLDVVGQVGAAQAKDGQQLVDVDPAWLLEL